MNRDMPSQARTDYLATGDIDFPNAVFLALQDSGTESSRGLFESFMAYFGRDQAIDEDFQFLTRLGVVKIRKNRAQIKDLLTQQPVTKESLRVRQLERKVKAMFPELEPVFSWGTNQMFVAYLNGKKFFRYHVQLLPDADKIPVGPDEIVIRYTQSTTVDGTTKMISTLRRNSNGNAVIVNHIVKPDWKPGENAISGWTTLIGEVSVDLNAGAKWKRGTATNDTAIHVHEYAKQRQTS
jgi:uncharacterized protein YdhG (YjbR/CyaY superfamily)